jgi:hypothetical protein
MNRKTFGIIVLVLVVSCIRNDDQGGNGEQEVTCKCTPVEYKRPEDWAHKARIANADLDPYMGTQEVMAVIEQRASEGVSVLEMDVGLSQYMDDAEFSRIVAFLKCAACLAHNKGLQAVVYYPSLEQITENGKTAQHTMFKDHPEWVQQGLDGTPNVFYGSEEFWVPEQDESAWLSPNGGYRDVYLKRIASLAGTGLDGIWVDVPLFMDTGAKWTGAEPPTVLAFRAWCKEKAVCPEDVELPKAPDWKSDVFRAWIRFRHENLRDFLKAVYDKAKEVAPDIAIIVENFPMDYLDATDKGLDGAFKPDAKDFWRVWEVDSVSNKLGMQWATKEDFTSKIAMFKWARAADSGSPSWVFSYGNEPRDAGLVMGAALATGNSPFEVKTPEMFMSVGSDFRKQWFGFVQKHEDIFGVAEREAKVGIWYSSASRDYLDYPSSGGHYGLYVSTTPPTNDPDFWATEEGDSCMEKPHLGGWRGAVNTLVQLKIPFLPVLSPGNRDEALKVVKMLWLPSVSALSDDDVNAIKHFAQAGGVVIATGAYPGTMDELGNPMATYRLLDMFGGGADDYVKRYGNGLAIYTANDLARKGFLEFEDKDTAHEAQSAIERLVRIHVEDEVIVTEPNWLLVEMSRISEEKMILFVVNFEGLKQPITQDVKEVIFTVRTPHAKVVKVSFDSPDPDGTKGEVSFAKVGDGLYRFSANVDLFSVAEIYVMKEEAQENPPYQKPLFASKEREEAALAGLMFILEKMRDKQMEVPWRYGVFTNLIDKTDVPGQYAYGHMMTSEHMGLLLQVSACLGEEKAFEEAMMFVKDLMVSPLFGVVNWAMDPHKKRPVLQQDEEGSPWRNGNAPIDDFRVVQGLLTGASNFSLGEAKELAHLIGRGLYWTSITDRDRDEYIDFPSFPGGLVAYAWNFEETEDLALLPQAKPTGYGEQDIDIVPLSYQDVETMAMLARYDPRWLGVISSTLDFIVSAEIQISGVPSGLFWNGFVPQTMTFSGDFEAVGTNQGKNLKTIQVLWTAIHLAGLVRKAPQGAEEQKLALAEASATRTLAFFRAFYEQEGRVPEYLTPEGTDVPDCAVEPKENCLYKDKENLYEGEARIYALLARLALFLGEKGFASKVIEEKILTDRVKDQADERYGAIGVKTANEGDAEAWNVLESVYTLCLEASLE